jgi:hypothetical protein
MAIVLTNGIYFITEGENKQTNKTQKIEEAKIYHSCNLAMQKKFECRRKCHGYYPYDTDDNTCEVSSYGKEKRNQANRSQPNQRRTFTREEKMFVYNKANGRCQLCGKQLNINKISVDHIIPLAKGGLNDLDNLQLACSSCNEFKGCLYPEEYVDKIKEILIYQMEKKNGNSLKWKIVHRLIMSMS